MRRMQLVAPAINLRSGQRSVINTQGGNTDRMANTVCPQVNLQGFAQRGVGKTASQYSSTLLLEALMSFITSQNIVLFSDHNLVQSA
ncbi:hypothetical protein PC114_g13419 [Phytophthora cactorum]|uniref:Uncharacterized protein n=1 Tax=Phytophthora cactorum TaxID=29920 RepID=A0A8T1D124_9STRA|nr:hypothetical protein PC114_g13419 [Phytophthora cactorum]KAG2932889.1 hypothetical protein PC117_g13023 [Phytophthora cactorum]KAG2996599.1 hypothetical protein PC120_g21461 [Phytophthora cactorum]